MRTHVLDLFEEGALRRCPDRIGFSDAGEQFTFRQIEQGALRIAAEILQRRDILNCPVAVFLPRQARELIADLGVLYSGNFYVNIDEQAPPSRTRHVLANVDPPLVLTCRSHAARLLALDYPAEWLVLIDDAFGAAAAADAPGQRERLGRLIDTDPVCLINTSGSTGAPKSVVLTHRGMIDFITWWEKTLPFREDEIVGSLSPFFFDIYHAGFLLTLLKGARVEVLPAELAAFPARLLEYMRSRKVTFIFWVPSVMVTIANLRLLEKIPLPHLTTVCFAGEVLPTRHLNGWSRSLPRATFVNLYGPVEISVICTYYIVDRPFADDEPLPIGFPCHNTDVLILNEHDRPCGVNEPGELCVRGSCLASGYWNDPAATSRAFVQNPLNTRYPELVYRTGDVALRNERGELMFLGRKDAQVKHLGHRFDLGEIEHFVLRIPGMDEACVCYEPERREIHLFYRADEDFAPAAIRTRLGADLPKHMWPTHFHRVDALPRNPNGKIDRSRLQCSLRSE